MTGLSAQMYGDLKTIAINLSAIFTEKLAPAINSGAVITKDYVLDLFGRYIQYSITLDIITILGIIALFAFLPSWRKKVQAFDKTNPEDDGGAIVLFIIFAVFSVFVGTFVLGHTIEHLAQSIFIPELTIYEKIVELKEQKSQ